MATRNPTTAGRRGRPKKLENLTPEALIEQGQALFAEIVQRETEPTDLYRELALRLVHLRRHFSSRIEGVPDWAGRSAEYRAAAAQIYAAADIPPDSETSIQARVRYHVSQTVRKVAPAAELKQLGLKEQSRAEAAVETRRERREASETGLSFDGPIQIETRADLYRACRQALEAILPQLPIAEADDPAYVDSMRELVELATLAEQLWAVSERRRSDIRNRLQILNTYQTTRTVQPKTMEEMAELRHRIAVETRQLQVAAGSPAELTAAANAA